MTPDEFRAIRESLGMNKAQLAAALDVRRASVSDWERGVKPIKNIYALALKYIQTQHQGAPHR